MIDDTIAIERRSNSRYRGLPGQVPEAFWRTPNAIHTRLSASFPRVDIDRLGVIFQGYNVCIVGVQRQPVAGWFDPHNCDIVTLKRRKINSA